MLKFRQLKFFEEKFEHSLILKFGFWILKFSKFNKLPQVRKLAVANFLASGDPENSRGAPSIILSSLLSPLFCLSALILLLEY